MKNRVKDLLRRRKKLDSMPRYYLNGKPVSKRKMEQAGYVNRAGAGTSRDALSGSQWLPDAQWSKWRGPMEAVRAQSWVARNFIDMIVDDSLSHWRRFLDAEEGEAMTMLEERLGLVRALGDAWKAARLHGSGFIYIATVEEDASEPLDLRMVGPGDVVALMPLDRWDLYPLDWGTDWKRQDFASPVTYGFRPVLRGGYGLSLPTEIHASRLIRIDGLRPTTISGWSNGNYINPWGLPELLPVMDEVNRDAATAAGSAHAAEQQGMIIFGLKHFYETMAAEGTDTGESEVGDPTLTEVAQAQEDLLSTFKNVYKGKDDEVSVINQSLTGLADLLDRFPHRVAAAGGYPVTRFMGRSPGGLNATGESDAANYGLRVLSEQRRVLTEPLRRLDAVLARELLMQEPPKWEWKPAIQPSAMQEEEAVKTRVAYISEAIAAGFLTPQEGRAIFKAQSPGLAEHVGDEMTQEPPKPEMEGQDATEDGSEASD